MKYMWKILMVEIQILCLNNRRVLGQMSRVKHRNPFSQAHFFMTNFNFQTVGLHRKILEISVDSFSDN